MILPVFLIMQQSSLELSNVKGFAVKISTAMRINRESDFNPVSICHI